MARLLGRIFRLGCSLCLLGCALVRSPKTPMPTVSFVDRGPERAAGAIILLPGLGDRPEDFDREGFVARLKRHAPDHDIIGVDAHIAYYQRGMLLERLEADVVGPLHRAGYRELWIVGVSMGALGSIGYARLNPERIRGILLIAPFLGEGRVVRDIGRVADLCSWQSGATTIESKRQKFFRDNWRWLQERYCSGAPGPELWVGFGDDDRPGPAGHRLLDKLPGDHIHIVPGGHGWKAWRPLLDILAPMAFGEARGE